MKQVYRAKEVAKMLSVSTSSIWRWTKAGVFPKPIKIGNRVTIWRKEDIDSFLK